MKKIKLVKEKRQRYCLYLEKVLIVSFLTITIIEMVVIVNLLNFYNTNSTKYFYTLMEDRLVIKDYLANLKAIDKNRFKLLGNKCPEPSTPISILQISSFSKVNLNEITNQTLQPDYHPNSTTGVINITNSSHKYYNFDLNNTGNSTINFITRYQFVNWRKLFMCNYQIKLQSSDAILFYPKDLDCNNMGKNVLECGIYFETYKICINLEKLIIGDQTLYDLMNNYDSINLEDFCPYNYININFADFLKEKIWDPENIKKYTTLVRKNIEITNPINQNNINKNILVRTDKTLVGNYQKINSPSDIIKDIGSEYNIAINSSLGFFDDLNIILDNYTFVEFYNDTYYNNSVTNKNTGDISYNPEFFKGQNPNNFYIPIDLANEENKLRVFFTTYNLKLFSVECFNNVFNVDGDYKYNFFKMIYQNSTLFLQETLYVMLAWVIVKMFISIYWDIKIRWVIINNLLMNSLNQADIDSEYITKLTAKAVHGVVFAILIFGSIFQEISFMKIQSNCDALLKNKCFESNLINDSINSYLDFIKTIKDQNHVLITLLIISGGMEGFLIVYYILDVIWMKAQDNLMNLLNLNKLKNEEKNEENIPIKESNFKNKKAN